MACYQKCINGIEWASPTSIRKLRIKRINSIWSSWRGIALVPMFIDTTWLRWISILVLHVTIRHALIMRYGLENIAILFLFYQSTREGSIQLPESRTYIYIARKQNIHVYVKFFKYFSLAIQIQFAVSKGVIFLSCIYCF